MKRILIIGAGHFGQKAVKVLSRMDPGADITVVDRNQNNLAHLVVKTVCGDGIAHLCRKLSVEDPVDWIIPAIPIHVAYEWLRIDLKNSYAIKRVPVPASVVKMLPHPIYGHNDAVYMSNADFFCPEDCSEPEGVCSFTGKVDSWRNREPSKSLG